MALKRWLFVDGKAAYKNQKGGLSPCKRQPFTLWLAARRCALFVLFGYIAVCQDDTFAHA